MAIMDLSPVVFAFAVPGGLTVTEPGPISWVDGRPVEAAGSTFTADPISIQDATERERLDLPEGQRSLETKTLFALVELKTATSLKANRGHRFTYEGSQWEIVKSGRWDTNGNYYSALAQKVEEG